PRLPGRKVSLESLWAEACVEIEELTEWTGNDLLMIQEPHMPITGSSLLPTYQATALLCYMIPNIVVLSHVGVIIYPKLLVFRMLGSGDHTFDYVIPKELCIEQF